MHNGSRVTFVYVVIWVRCTGPSTRRRWYISRPLIKILQKDAVAVTVGMSPITVFIVKCLLYNVELSLKEFEVSGFTFTV